MTFHHACRAWVGGGATYGPGCRAGCSGSPDSSQPRRGVVDVATTSNGRNPGPPAGAAAHQDPVKNSGGEAVTHPRLGVQVPRVRRIGLELAAQLVEVDAQVVRLLLVRRAPDRLQQVLLADQPARCPDQLRQQPPLGRRQPDDGAVDGDPLGRQVDGEVLGRDHRLVRLRGPAPLHRAQPGQQLAHVEGLGDVVVGAGVQRADLVVAVRAGRQHEHRPGEPRPQPGQHLGAVEVGQAQVEDDEIGVVVGGVPQRRAAVGSGEDVVAGRVQRDPQGPGDLRVVVDDEDPAHRAGTGGGSAGGPAAASDTTMVSPPPGASSASTVPPIASVTPRATASPSPTPWPAGASPRRWNGANSRSRSASGTPGPWSVTRSSTRSSARPAAPRSSAAPAVIRTGPAGACRTALLTRFATTRSSRPGSARADGTSSGQSRATRRRSPTSSHPSARPATAGRSVGPQAGLTTPACSRLMSNRLSTSALSRSADSSMVATSSARSSSVSCSSPVRSADDAALMPASGVRRSWLTAASRAVRMLWAAASRSASAACLANRPCCSATAACSANATSTRRSLAGSDRPASRRARVSVTGTVSPSPSGADPHVLTTRSSPSVVSTIDTAC